MCTSRCFKQVYFFNSTWKLKISVSRPCIEHSKMLRLKPATDVSRARRETGFCNAQHETISRVSISTHVAFEARRLFGEKGVSRYCSRENSLPNRLNDRSETANWNQMKGWVILSITFGFPFRKLSNKKYRYPAGYR